MGGTGSRIGGTARVPSSLSRLSGLSCLAVLVFLAAHLAFLPASLEDLDSINFALGLRRFDVAAHRPHPPGYPVYIAAGKLVRAIVADEGKALAVISGVAGGLGVLALAAFFSELDPSRPRRWSIAAALLAAASPLYWVTAARPLSDTAGLAASIAIQALALSAVAESRVVVAAALAGVAMGLRSQVAWLTVPVLLYTCTRQPAGRRAPVALMALAALAAGVAVWAIPLVTLTGGPSAYWVALFNQGAEDLSGIQMLWTRPTTRQLQIALHYAFVAPWATWPMAEAVLIAAIAGAIVLAWRDRSVLASLAVAFGPYFVFDLLFQETFTTRYALPLVVPVAYLAARAAALLPQSIGLSVAVGVALLNAIVGGFDVQAYGSRRAPAFRMLDDMSSTPSATRAAGPVLAMHRREDLDLRRPLDWAGDAVPRFSRRLPAPPKHEWLELVKYWNSGGREPVWFVADPQRTDLALVDRSTARSRAYAWSLDHPELIGGVRPSEMVWHVVDAPGWYLGEGWSLTPETAGVAQEDRRGPGISPIQGWIRRRHEPATVMIGGRNLASGGPAARITISVDGRSVEEIQAPPGFFLRLLTLPAGRLEGPGDYATLSVASDRPDVVIEQFDAQSFLGRMVFGFGEGWHEREFNPTTRRLWRWMSERGVIRVRGARATAQLSLRGETETFSRPSHVVARIGDRVVGDWMVGRSFAVQARIPADVLGTGDRDITIEADQFFVPAERSRRTQDRRHLALRVYDAELTPVS